MNTQLSFDLSKANTNFEANPSRNRIQMASFTKDDAPLILTLKGKATADSIYKTEFGGKANYSIPMDLEDLQTVKTTSELLAAQVQKVVPEWPVNDPFGKEEFWLRLNFNHRRKEFKTTNNLGLNTKNVEKIGDLLNKKIIASVEVKAWFDMVDQKAGVSLNVINVIFD